MPLGQAVIFELAAGIKCDHDVAAMAARVSTIRLLL